MARRLSKSKLIAGIQCQRRLWLEANRKDLIVITPDMQRRFDQGHQLNDVVHQLYPNGSLIEDHVSLSDALKITQQHLATRPEIPLFEATFRAHEMLVRADIFVKQGDRYHLTEVKSSTQVKDYHLNDCAIQHNEISQ